jgi:hypothetical protein
MTIGERKSWNGSVHLDWQWKYCGNDLLARKASVLVTFVFEWSEVNLGKI